MIHIYNTKCEKDIVALAKEFGIKTGGVDNAINILEFAQAYADQEKRKTAKAFAKWTAEEGWTMGGAVWYPFIGGDLPLTEDQLYNLFIRQTESK